MERKREKGGGEVSYYTGRSGKDSPRRPYLSRSLRDVTEQESLKIWREQTSGRGNGDAEGQGGVRMRSGLHAWR